MNRITSQVRSLALPLLSCFPLCFSPRLPVRRGAGKEKRNACLVCTRILTLFFLVAGLTVLLFFFFVHSDHSEYSARCPPLRSRLFHFSLPPLPSRFAPRSPVHAPLLSISPFTLLSFVVKSRPLHFFLHAFSCPSWPVPSSPFAMHSLTPIWVIHDDQRISHAPEQSLDESKYLQYYSRPRRDADLSPSTLSIAA